MPNHDASARYLRRQHPTEVTGFTWEFTGESLTVLGNCPRCRGETSYQPPIEVQVGVTKGPGGPAKIDRMGPEETYMVCRCAHAHPGDTQEKGGCGLSWTAVRPPAGSS
ncbi:hypothetical protein ACFT7S_21820 [Streptomyces sp. NPDC057136]|uniref:hypothetical protein n=1 Tax=Streptomyces sp. NPDC057136 TaxID=3346029 RepID=UPI00363F0CA3